MGHGYAELLMTSEDRGYPADYLLTRIKSRRTRLIRDWGPLLSGEPPSTYLASERYGGFVRDSTPEGVNRDLLLEYRWVYSQMNAGLREAFLPFFLYAELRTLFICLRYIKEGRPQVNAEMLAPSLLSGKIKTILLSRDTVAEAVAGLEPILMTMDARFKGIAEVAKKEGLRAAEQEITNRYLRQVLGTKLHPALKEFFVRLVDARNIITLSKHLRLHPSSAASFIPGGSIPVRQLSDLLRREDMGGTLALIHEAAGMRLQVTDPRQLETALYRGITLFLRKNGKAPFGLGPILDYLWRCSIEAMNLTIMMFGKNVARDLLKEELVT